MSSSYRASPPDEARRQRAPGKGGRWRKALLACLGVLVLLLLTRDLWLSGMGNFLVDSDPLQPADALVVLAGNAPERLRHAEQLYAEGYAPLILISDEEVRTHGMDTTWYQLYQRGLTAQGLPPDAVIPLDPPPQSTVDEARQAAVVLSQRGARSVILVTDPFHSRRARLLFAARLRPYGISLISSPSSGGKLDLSRWWMDPGSSRTVLEEYAKLILYGIEGAYS